MTGPEHYIEAERLLAESRIPARERATPGWLTDDELREEANVHATLAVAAATALAADPELRPRDLTAWWEAAGTRRPTPTPAGDDVVLSFTRDQVNAWVGRPLTDHEFGHLDYALPLSTLPETIGQILDSFSDSTDDESKVRP
jgi:hypothetical protein